MQKTPEQRKAYLKAWREANKQRCLENSAKSQAKRKENWDAFLADERRRYAARADEINARQREYRQRNPEARARTVKKYAANNPDLIAENWAARRNRKRNAMPKWVDRSAIKAIYAHCQSVTKSTGIKHEVDHIIPLRGKIVCGLHVPWNLQVITQEENRRKGYSIGHINTA